MQEIKDNQKNHKRFLNDLSKKINNLSIRSLESLVYKLTDYKFEDLDELILSKLTRQ